MSKKLYEEANVSAIAAAIRLKNGLSLSYTVSEMASAILSIETDYVLESLNVSENGIYSLPEGIDGFDEVIVNVPSQVLSSITISENGNYVPSQGIDAFSQVVVSIASGKEQEDMFLNRTIISYSNSVLSRIGEYTFTSCISLKSIICENCEIIGSYAFSNCQSLQSVSFPECTTIGTCAFQYCISLQNISFPKCTTIEGSAFQSCTSLQSVSFPECVTIYGSAFYRCSHLISVYLLGSIVVDIINANVFNNTPISVSTYVGSFGSIFVPESLINEYKTASNWIRYSNRIVAYSE